MGCVQDMELDLVWRKSSRSGGQSGGQCVEVAEMVDGMAVRDSKDPAGGHFAVRCDAWKAFVATVRDGRLS